MEFFEYKSPDFGGLTEYGFKEKDGVYGYSTRILDRQFELKVFVAKKSGEVTTEMIDLSTNEPYTLHLVNGVGGSFVGSVRAEYESVLAEIAERCFSRDVFKSELSHEVISFIRKTYGDEPEYLWKTFPSNAIWRRSDNRKWYGIIVKISERKLGLDSDKVIDAVDLRAAPEEIPALIDGNRYFPGYHMNKKNWITVRLDGSVPFDEICERIAISYDIAKKS